MSLEDHRLRGSSLSLTPSVLECSRRIPLQEGKKNSSSGWQLTVPVLYIYIFWAFTTIPCYSLGSTEVHAQKHQTGNGERINLHFPTDGEKKANAILENPAKTRLNSDSMNRWMFASNSTPNFLFPAKGSETWTHKVSLGRGARPPRWCSRLKPSRPSVDGWIEGANVIQPP